MESWESRNLVNLLINLYYLLGMIQPAGAFLLSSWASSSKFVKFDFVFLPIAVLEAFCVAVVFATVLTYNKILNKLYLWENEIQSKKFAVI